MGRKKKSLIDEENKKQINNLLNILKEDVIEVKEDIIEIKEEVKEDIIKIKEEHKEEVKDETKQEEHQFISSIIKQDYSSIIHSLSEEECKRRNDYIIKKLRSNKLSEDDRKRYIKQMEKNNRRKLVF